MTRTTKALLVTVVGSAALALSAASASAAIVCNGDVCWHVKERYKYPSESKVIIREDGWKAGPSIKFREHEGRGYWRSGVWVDF